VTRVILALAGLSNEPDLVKAAQSAGLDVVRRCVDAADLLGAAAGDPTCPVVVAATLPRLAPDVVARLGDRVLVGLASDGLGVDRLSRMGLGTVIATAPTAQATMQQIADVCTASVASAASARTTAFVSSPDDDLGPRVAAAPSEETPLAASTPAGEARRSSMDGVASIVAVWGPMGAPGRTTVAVGVAEALADQGARVCLIDADTYAPSITLALGLVEETSGLASACRSAEAGTLRPSGLASLTMAWDAGAEGRWRVLGGIDHPDRWVDLRPVALERVWSVAREAFDVIVIDTGFCLEVDSSPAAWGRQRNAAAVSAFGAADHVVAVGDASPVGAVRLLAGMEQVAQASPGVPVTLVRNRASGRGREWRDLVGERTGVHRMVDVPADAGAVQRCWDTGRSLGEGARRSRVRRAMGTLAASVVSR
jgi:Mrp family chromosome partitioning ATPase